MRIQITVPGEPVAKARPRFTKSGHVYTPQKTAVFEQAVRLHAMAAMKGRKILTGAVRLAVTAYMPIPKSWSMTQKTKAMAGQLRHTKRPDSDNLCKAVQDALNGVIYADDAQIDDSRIVKKYGVPRTEIIVEADDVDLV